MDEFDYSGPNAFPRDSRFFNNQMHSETTAADSAAVSTFLRGTPCTCARTVQALYKPHAEGCAGYLIGTYFYRSNPFVNYIHPRPSLTLAVTCNSQRSL